VTWVVFHFLTGYIVLCSCILWLSISSTFEPCSRVVGVMGEGDACVSAGLLILLVLFLERLMRVSKVVGVCAGSPLVLR